MEDSEVLRGGEVTEAKSDHSITALMEMDVSRIESQVLRRLVDEVRHEEAEGIQGYSRFHNRHNRTHSRPWFNEEEAVNEGSRADEQG